MKENKTSWLYKNSLSVVLLLMFLFSLGGQVYTGIQEYNSQRIEDGVPSFALHLYGSHKDFNEEQLRKGKATKPFVAYLSEPRPWFESFQNWQSEFVSVAAIVVLSIYLRQKGSPESKPVDAPHMETGK